MLNTIMPKITSYLSKNKDGKFSCNECDVVKQLNGEYLDENGHITEFIAEYLPECLEDIMKNTENQETHYLCGFAYNNGNIELCPLTKALEKAVEAAPPSKIPYKQI